ncbi:helix-turn-helix domain containing protein [bacterium]|jgi:DNA-binding CsgD family transcriptional regulator|nr:helix-turn-helix domain containing protein [bacterium]
MAQHNRQFLNKNEKAIVELILKGENQISIARQLNISPSTIYRALRREHVVNILNQATQGLLSNLVQRNLSIYEKALDRIDKEIETMPIKQVIYYMNHVKQALQNIHTDEAKSTLKKLKEDQVGPIEVEIQYSDTQATIEREVQKQLLENEKKK